MNANRPKAVKYQMSIPVKRFGETAKQGKVPDFDIPSVGLEF